MAPDAPKIHSGGNLCQSRHVTRGDAAAALAASAYTVTKSFSTPFTEHAFLEPECAVAFPYKDGVKILSTDQGAYDTRKETAIMFGWDPERVVVENQLVGGGFGGKEDVSVQHISALAAWIFKRPVKAKLSRQESINFHPKRHAMEGTFTLGCDENGIFTGLDCEIYFDTGAYASLCGPVLERACTHSVGPYCYQNTDIRGYGYYTNNPPAGAFRGFGVCQSEFALETIINLLAEKVGISPWEIRFRNAIEPGKVLPNGQIADCSTALKETLLAVKDVYEANRDHAGIACAMKNAGVGVGLPDKGRARLVIEDGVCVICCAASDIDFARNIESSNLKYRKKEDKKLEVTVELTSAKGEKTEVKYGASGGKTIKRVGHGVSEEEAKKIAENEYNLWCYDGYEGSFTGWLIPYVEPGDAVRLRDTDYPKKEGVYYVTGTEISFSKEGGKRTVSLGRWLSK